MEYKYSIIIPHRNSEKTLRRCLNSIPQRNDIQIIVVDDYSNETINWDKLHKDYKHIRIIYSPICLGAGNARNKGLEEATGKWLLFADADDFYTAEAWNILDKYAEYDIDILYFNAISIDYETMQKSNRCDLLNKYIKAYKKNGSFIDHIKFLYRAPWFKMYKRSFIQKYKICFEETIKGNDMQFSYITSYLAQTTKIIEDKVYVCTYSNTSMSYKSYNIETYVCIFENTLKNNSFFKFIGHPEWRKNPIRNILYVMNKEGLIKFFKYFMLLCCNLKSIYRNRNRYIHMIQERNSH